MLNEMNEDKLCDFQRCDWNSLDLPFTNTYIFVGHYLYALCLIYSASIHRASVLCMVKILSILFWRRLFGIAEEPSKKKDWLQGHDNLDFGCPGHGDENEEHSPALTKLQIQMIVE